MTTKKKITPSFAKAMAGKKKPKKAVKKTTPSFAKASAYTKVSADKSAGKKKPAKKTAAKKSFKKKSAFVKTSADKKNLTLVGVVTHYYDKIKVAIFKVKSPIQIGQKLRFSNTEGTIFEQPIISIQINHESVKKAKKGAVIGMKVKKQVHENNKVYLIK
jgi:hypothetical protein